MNVLTPFFDGYTPQFFFRTTNVTGKTHVIGDVQLAMPGDGVQLQVNLLQPIALTTGDHFAIREVGKTVGSGVFTKVSLKKICVKFEELEHPAAKKPERLLQLDEALQRLEEGDPQKAQPVKLRFLPGLPISKPPGQSALPPQPRSERGLLPARG